MSIYWKQSLWLGGLYWVISLVFTLVDTFETYMADFILSMLLTLSDCLRQTLKLKAENLFGRHNNLHLTI
jgi:hypothetical protein